MHGIADAATRMRHVFLRGMVLQASIGIYPHEHEARQRIRVNVDLGVMEGGGEAENDPAPGADRLERVVDYEQVADAVRRIVAGGHVKLVETLAERIAASCLLDPRVRLARIRVEKLDVFADTEAAGVEVERMQAGTAASKTGISSTGAIDSQRLQGHAPDS